MNMIKLIKITPLDYTKHLYYKCESCGEHGEIFLHDSIINVDNDGNLIEGIGEYDCPACKQKLY